MQTGPIGTPPARLDLAVDSLLEPVIVTDEVGVVTFANAAAVARLGADKYLGVALVEQAERGELHAPDGRPVDRADHPVPRALATRAPVIGVHVVVSLPGGDRRRWSVNTAPLRDGERVLGTVSVFHDVTPAAELESALADHAQRLEAMLNLVSDAVLVIDADGRLGFANALGLRLLGVSAGEGLGTRHESLDVRDVEGRPLAPAARPWSVALAGGTVSGLALLVQDPAGKTRHVTTGAHPLRRPDGSVYAALVTMKDGTEEVRWREASERARETAEEANHLKDQFIAALSHELRTPLQPILGWTEVLKRHHDLDAVTSQALDAIRRNIRQQVRLVDDLLDLSRIVHGKLTLRYEAFDLRDHVRAATEPFVEMAAVKRVKLTVALPEGSVMTWGDGARVQQITTNIVSNAMKFTPAGGRISVQLVASPTEALLEVEDSGEGIPPEELATIFEPFRQGSLSRRGGLGIGLDLVRRLTGLLGGTVEAFSEGPGYGARFSVRLPLGWPTAAPGPPPALARRPLERKRILVIEDNTDTRDVMRFMLETEGAEVATAETGQEGVARAAEWQPEIVLCDIGLPDIDGLEVARRIRKGAPTAPRLISLTGYGQPDDIRHAFDAGFEAHLTKPINLDELLRILAAP